MSGQCLHLTDLWLADGTGSPLKKSEILVCDGRIAAVGKQDIGTGAGSVIKCKNMVAAPGFIDAHGHSDISSLVSMSSLHARTTQGVTCEIAGNCGLSAFPVTEMNCDHLQKLYAKYNFEIPWQSCAEMREYARSKNLACSIEYLAGHNTLRGAVAGYGAGELDEEQLDLMCALLDKSLEEGALGLSLGLLYVPGKFYTPEELKRLFRTVAMRNKIVACHLKSEGRMLLESLEEMISYALESGLKKLHISHFKTAGEANFHKLDPALEMMDAAREQGLDITFDRYPYTQSMTQLSIVLPDEWSDIDDVTITRKLQDDGICRKVLYDLRRLRDEEYWKGVILVNTPLKEYDCHCGKTFDRIPGDPAEVVVEMLRCNSPMATAAFTGMSVENMMKIISDPRCLAGSDGTSLPPDGTYGYDHPRSYGAISRFMRLLLDSNVPIEETVRRVTGLAADTFQLSDAGYIRPGASADITVFNPSDIDSYSSFIVPTTPSRGIRHVIKRGVQLM